MDEYPFERADEIGPDKIIYVYEPATQLKGILVVDNVAAGPSIGGLRMASDVSLQECFRLARAMTLKNAAAGLAHGGGKSVIAADPRMPAAAKERLVRAFAARIAPIEDYIAGPDMGTDEACMAWVKSEIGRAVGLPPEIGGIPLDELGATGYGLCAAIDVASGFCDLALDGARVAVQGFGSVGRHGARFLTEKGAIVVGVSDSRGAVHDPDGIDLAELTAIKVSGRPVTDYPRGTKLARDDIIDVECEIWIPAARPDVLNEDNVHRLKTRLVAEGANIPATPQAERALHDKGVLVLPDFIANAGGVICAAVEYAGGTRTMAFSAIDDKVRANVRTVLERSRAESISTRAAALAFAEQRVRKVMSFARKF